MQKTWRVNSSGEVAQYHPCLPKGEVPPATTMLPRFTVWIADAAALTMRRYQLPDTSVPLEICGLRNMSRFGSFQICQYRIRGSPAKDPL